MQYSVDELAAKHLKDVVALNRRCDSHEGVLVQALADGLVARCSALEKRAVCLESNVEALQRWPNQNQKMHERVEHAEEALAVLAQNLKEEVRERTVLSNSIVEESAERTKGVSAVWLEVANVQQQVAGSISDLRESLLGDLRVQLDGWKDNLSAAVDKQQVDLSSLRSCEGAHVLGCQRP